METIKDGHHLIIRRAGPFFKVTLTQQTTRQLEEWKRAIDTHKWNITYAPAQQHIHTRAEQDIHRNGKTYTRSRTTHAQERNNAYTGTEQYIHANITTKVFISKNRLCFVFETAFPVDKDFSRNSSINFSSFSYSFLTHPTALSNSVHKIFVKFHLGSTHKWVSVIL